MTLARRIVLKTVVLTAALIAAGAGMLTGMLTLQGMTASTREEFEELREVRRVDRSVQAAIQHVTVGDPEAVGKALAAAIAGLAEFEEYQETKPSEFGETHADAEERFGAQSLTALQLALAHVTAHPVSPDWAVEVEADLRQATRRLDQLADEIEAAVAAVHARTAQRFRATTWVLLALALLSVGAGLLTSILHYRSVMRPLRELRAGTDRLARRELGVRLDLSGDREFFELKSSFNHMAEELESLCHNLEERVARQSKELAVAERLASVGFLAAGVAHEINNPLAIMSGYAESLLRRLQALNPDADLKGDYVHDLQTIRDEAFRCKKITQSLLDLSRMGDPHRSAVSLRAVAESCIRLIRSWPGCGDIGIELRPHAADACTVFASEPEMRQVVLNLLTNAVEAAPAHHGHVVVSLSEQNGCVELRVCDNGRGMDSETLNHVFEPFFTRGKGRVGLGLGLSISHAIASRQNGELTAHSEGPGTGSAFVLRLPVHKEVMA